MKSCISNLGEKKAQRPVSPELIKFRQQRSKFMQKQISAFLVLHSCVSLVLFSTFSYYFVYDSLQKNTYANDSSQFLSNFNIFMFFINLNPFQAIETNIKSANCKKVTNLTVFCKHYLACLFQVKNCFQKVSNFS